MAMTLAQIEMPSRSSSQWERQLAREGHMRETGMERHLKRVRALRKSRLLSQTGGGRDLLADNLGVYVEAVRAAYFSPTSGRPSDIARALRGSGVTPERVAAVALQTLLDGIFDEPPLIAVAREVGRAVLIEALAHQLEVGDRDGWSAVSDHFKALRILGHLDEVVELLVDAVDHFGAGIPVRWDSKQRARIGVALVELAIESTGLLGRFQPPYPDTGDL